MSLLLFILLALIAFRMTLDLIATLLNRGNLTPTLSQEILQEFSTQLDPEKYKESISYQRELSAFSIFQILTEGVIVLSFLALGGLDYAVTLTTKPQSPILSGLLFFGLLALLKGSISLPFSIYHTFVIEEKYGFNRTTVRTFVMDLVKGTILGVLLGGLILGGILAFLMNAGTHAWLWAWLALTTFQIALTFIAPVWILPLFNQYIPLTEGPLKNAIEDYAQKNNFTLHGIYTMDGSKRSTKANAFFTGFGKHRRLVLFDTLLTRYTTEELMGIVAHEAGHFKLGHIPKSLVLAVLGSGLLFYLLSLFLAETGSAIPLGLVLFNLALSPLMRLTGIFTHALSRKHEYDADAFSIQTYGKPLGKVEALASALKKLSQDSFSHLNPHPLRVWLDYTHPPILLRLKRLRELALH